jgi:hypothetical protein
MPRPTCALAFVLALPLAAVTAAAQDFAWHDDLRAARTRAADEGKPLLLLFRCEP